MLSTQDKLKIVFRTGTRYFVERISDRNIFRDGYFAAAQTTERAAESKSQVTQNTGTSQTDVTANIGVPVWTDDAAVGDSDACSAKCYSFTIKSTASTDSSLAFDCCACY